MPNSSSATSLRWVIGIYGASFLALNAMIGAGIFALPGRITANSGLPSPWLFLLVGMLFLAIGAVKIPVLDRGFHITGYRVAVLCD